MDKKPDANDSEFVKGPALTPADPLVTWLDGQKRGDEARLLRVPVVLAKTPAGSFTMRGATLGTASDALAIHINDSALGIGLTDRARKCKDARCAFAVEAYWRGKQDGTYQLDVMKVGDPLSADALAAFTHAEVQGESHN